MRKDLQGPRAPPTLAQLFGGACRELAHGLDQGRQRGQRVRGIGMSEIRAQRTGDPDIIEASDERLTLLMPIQIKRHRAHKLDTLPIDPVTGEPGKASPLDTVTTSLQLALARGHRWLAMLESGEAKSLKEIATQEGIDSSYGSRMVNLTPLAPDMVAAILDDAMPNHVTLFDLAVDLPALWDDQRARLR